MAQYQYRVPPFPEGIPIDGHYQREFLRTEDDCEALMVQLRWPEGITCPMCYADTIFRDEPRRRFGCLWCDRKFTVRTQTWLHKSRIPLGMVIRTCHCMTSRTYGVSASETEREEHVGNHTSWKLEHTLREVMCEDLKHEPPLSGVVEVDETWAGGRGKGHANRRNTKRKMVMGIVERGGRVFLEEGLFGKSRRVLHSFVLRHTGPSLTAIYTDGLASYNGIGDLTGAVHETVNHSKGEYVRDGVHTNTIESIWAGLDRMIFTTYAHVSRELLPLYLAEHAWRHNHRGLDSRDADLLRLLLQTPGYMLADWAEERRRLGL